MKFEKFFRFMNHGIEVVKTNALIFTINTYNWYLQLIFTINIYNYP